jgi:ribosomal protein S4
MKSLPYKKWIRCFEVLHPDLRIVKFKRPKWSKLKLNLDKKYGFSFEETTIRTRIKKKKKHIKIKNRLLNRYSEIYTRKQLKKVNFVNNTWKNKKRLAKYLPSLTRRFAHIINNYRKNIIINKKDITSTNHNELKINNLQSNQINYKLLKLIKLCKKKIKNQKLRVRYNTSKFDNYTHKKQYRLPKFYKQNKVAIPLGWTKLHENYRNGLRARLRLNLNTKKAWKLKTLKRNFNQSGHMLSFLMNIEYRLDNLCYRCGFFNSVTQAQKFINTKKVWVNGKCVSSHATLIKAGDIINFDSSLHNFIKKNLINRLKFPAILPFSSYLPYYLLINYNTFEILCCEDSDKNQTTKLNYNNYYNLDYLNQYLRQN